MKNLVLTATATIMLALAAPAARAAGIVHVSFIDPDKYTDIGFQVRERANAMDAIQRELEKFGAKLPDGQALKVEVLDIDLAGELRWPRNGHETRVLKGMADWPVIRLKYTLSRGEETVRTGEERLADMDYLHYDARLPDRRAYPHELRMVDAWFDRTFVKAR